MIEKINLDSIENILIFHHDERYEYLITFYLLMPIKYIGKKTFWSKILFPIFLIFHKDKMKIEEKFHDGDLLTIFTLLQDNLKNVKIPNMEENSLFWKTTDSGYSIPLVKLVYSKNEQGLSEVLKKYNILKTQ